MNRSVSGLGHFAVRHAVPIGFICFALCLAGLYAAQTLPSSVFPRTDFPRVVVLVDNGVMPADEMMATVTRPIEEAMKDIPGAMTIRSSTGCGAVEVNVFFEWRTDMIQAEQTVLGRLAQIRNALPPTVNTAVHRLTFASFPIFGMSLTGHGQDITRLWEAIALGLLLSMGIIYGFLKSWRATLTAAAVIPVTVLVTLVAMERASSSFNLMTLGGITAAIGLIIDDAIVVVEDIHAKLLAGANRMQAVVESINEIFRPLLGSTLTPVVVFLPLSFLDGIPGVFFRALALTMSVGLLTSLVLAITLTPSLAASLMGFGRSHEHPGAGGTILHRVIEQYEIVVRLALRRPGLVLLVCGGVLLFGLTLYNHLESDFLPAMEEGGFVLDYRAPWGTSFSENNRQLLQAEAILSATPKSRVIPGEPVRAWRSRFFWYSPCS
ncbi:MAG: efflux RND transporter permease subunit [Gammaproteobacteria bacterium]